MTKIGDICPACGKPWLPGFNGSVYHECGVRDHPAEIQRLRAALKEAIEEVESWGAYASPYFQQKHDLQGTLQRLREALKWPTS